MSKKEIIKYGAVFVSCFVVVLAVLILVFYPKHNSDGYTDSKVTESSEITENITEEMKTEDISTQPDTTEETTEETTAEEITTEADTTENAQSQPVSQSEEFIRLLSKGGVDIEIVDCSQLVIVESSGSSATVYFYEKQDSGIWQDMGLTVSGWVGSNGVDEKSQEGDYKTPFGLYSVGEAFYIYDQPETGLDSFQITENTYWVDDPDSQFYNQKVEGTDNRDWNSAEHMISYTQSYKYGFVVNFNMDPIVSGKGSAIFFHCGTAPTAGCIAVPESSVLSYLAQLDKDKNPYILLM